MTARIESDTKRSEPDSGFQAQQHERCENRHYHPNYPSCFSLTYTYYMPSIPNLL